VTMTGSYTELNFATNGGTIASIDSYVELSQCSSVHDTAIGDGGALWSSSSFVSMTNYSFKGNVAHGAGGVVFWIGIRPSFSPSLAHTHTSSFNSGVTLSSASYGSILATDMSSLQIYGQVRVTLVP
jgi:hypothetical protein